MKIKNVGSAISKFAHKPSAEWNLIDVGILTAIGTVFVTGVTLASYSVGSLIGKIRDKQYEEI